MVDHGIERQPQPVAALPIGQDRDARAQFGFGDGRKEKIASIMPVEPAQDSRRIKQRRRLKRENPEDRAVPEAPHTNERPSMAIGGSIPTMTPKMAA